MPDKDLRARSLSFYGYNPSLFGRLLSLSALQTDWES
jgi:hypothetical protein